MKRVRGEPLLPWAAALVAGIVLACDLFLELGVAVPVLYVVVVCLLHFTRRARLVIAAAMVCTVLTLVGLFVSPPGSTLFGHAVANRVAALTAIWLTTALGVRILRLLEEQTHRAEIAEDVADEIASERDREHHRLLALASVLGDLRIEREKLAESEERFRATVESAPVATVMIDDAGQIALVNSEVEKLFGYPREELLGEKIERLIPKRLRGPHPGHRRRFLRKPEARRMGAGRDLYALRRDGSEFPVEIGLSPIKTGEGQFVLAAIVDITERKRTEDAQARLSEELEHRVEKRTAELALANEALTQSNLELQQFAYVASHDLQTPLRAIVSFSQFLRDEYQDQLDDNANDYIRRIVAGTMRMRRMINDLLAYSRVESRATAFEPVDLGTVCDEALELLEASVRDSGGVVTRDELPVVHGDPAQLSQLLLNLLGNALKYHGTHPPEVHVSAAREDGVWVLSVRDNGIGIAPEHHERVFEIFRRLHTEHEYPGSGIGLGICRRIVQRHGGKIWLESVPGDGSTFHCTLHPAEEGRGAAGPTDDGHEQRKAG